MNKIVVYHSYTGHTRKIAELIANEINCDLLQLEPINAYSSNYDEVVKKYQNNDSSSICDPINKINKDIQKYDKIILGSPVWWYTITPVVRTFLKENDLSNKIIAPFATNAGWLGKTFKEIKKMCPNSIVEEGLDVVFSQDYSENRMITSLDEINNWIRKL